MRLRNYVGWILLLAAVCVGALAFYLVNEYLTSQEQQLRLDVMRERGPTEQVVVAKQALQAGAVIGPQTMALGSLPRQHVPSRAVLAADFKQFENRILSRPMSPGEPLLADFVAGMVIERFSDLLAPGERAVSIEVTSVGSHSGMLLPGDYVDLFALVSVQGGSKAARRKQLLPLLERVKVLAAGPEPLRTPDQPFQRLPSGLSTYSLITVGVPADDAERLLIARETDELAYLLRNASDEQHTNDLVRGRYGDDEAGYWYFSVGVPQGQRRSSDLHMPTKYSPHSRIRSAFGADDVEGVPGESG